MRGVALIDKARLGLYVVGVAIRHPQKIRPWLHRRRTRRRDEHIRAMFQAAYYIDINARRLEHLASLGLPLEGKSVLEVGAGIGDLTGFFLQRGCSVAATDARAANVEVMARRRPDVHTFRLDLEAPSDVAAVNVVFAYGVLYHLARPAEALAFLASCCRELLLLETWVSADEGIALNPVAETVSSPTQAASGTGCRPTREWVMAELRKSFPYVYATTTQPWHDLFPLDWNASDLQATTRAVFVASREPLELATLTPSLPARQTRH